MRDIPDSLLDRQLRTGLSVGINLYLPWGISLYNTYSPRSSDTNFGDDYTNNASLIFADLFSSGMTLRSSMNLNVNAFSNSTGYGIDLQRNILGFVEASFRYQHYTNTLRRISQRTENSTIGGDLIFTIARGVTLFTSYDKMQGLGVGADSQSIFAEITVRF